eukprot:scaffold14555_cov100-Cylindrotheca_fusiformis.AAC.1
METRSMKKRSNKRKGSEIEKGDPEFFVYTTGTKPSDIPKKTLTHLRVDSSVREIPMDAFGYCEALVQVQLPETLTRIGRAAFDGCSELKCIQFVSEGSPKTSSNKPNLEEDGTVVFPERAKLQIDDRAFYQCRSLEKVIVCSATTIFDEAVFAGCYGLFSVELPEGLQVIEPNLFACCNALPTVKIPSSVIKIGAYAFHSCSNLTSADLPHGLLEIEEGSFQDCRSIRTLRIPCTVSSIGESAFENCDALVQAEFPETLTEIGKTAFKGCSSLKCVHFFPNSTFATSSNNHSLGDGIIVFPERTKVQIDESAFSECHSLRKVIVCSVSMSFGFEVFGGCSGLTSVELPEGLPVIEEDLFFDCKSLASVNIPSSVIKIGQ